MILYGTPKCRLTRKVQRFASERKIPLQFRDISDTPPAEGELRNLARGLGGEDALLDKECKAWKDLGMAHREFNPLEALQEHPELMKTPLLRDGQKVWAIGETTDLKTLLG